MAAALFGDAKLEVLGSGPTPAANVLAGKQFVLLYFSAHWCGPCRAFTPRLKGTYEALKLSRNDFECVFVSADQDEADFKSYHAEMPWPALNPFEFTELSDSLRSSLNVEGFPTVIVLDAAGKVIAPDAVQSIAEDPKGERFP